MLLGRLSFMRKFGYTALENCASDTENFFRQESTQTACFDNPVL